MCANINIYICIHTYITLHYGTLHYITLRYTTLRYTTLHTYLHTYIHTWITYIHTNIYIVYMHIFICIYNMCIYVKMYSCINVYMHICIYAYRYICIYTNVVYFIQAFSHEVNGAARRSRNFSPGITWQCPDPKIICRTMFSIEHSELLINHHA